MKELGVPPPRDCLNGRETSGGPQAFAVQSLLPIRLDPGDLENTRARRGHVARVPLALVEGALTMSATFIRKVGAEQAG
jgi:hypothetical protein